MKIILTNGTELQPLMVTGAKRTVQGATRDCLSFVFDNTVSLDEMDSIFTEANCESINIIGDDESEAIHTGYTIRAELKKYTETSAQETSETEVQTVTRIVVSMAQRTYAETKLAALSAESTDTQLAVAELAELLAGGAE